MSELEVIIGLEIHAELKTKSKMFCACSNSPFDSEPNSNICPVCTGQPGSLPVPNKQAILWTYLVGRALGAKLNNAKFDRKHYYYPDLPKGYQISQYDLPFTSEGALNIESHEIKIIRVHLEEDTGKLIHPVGADYSLLDLNRAGVPLMEMVTYPEITSAIEARKFCESYQKLLRDLEIASADMEKGEMRCEANISVQRRGTFVRDGAEIKPIKGAPLNPKIEVKNLNSFRAVERAIDYEIGRQTKALEEGEELRQETRGWNEHKGVTIHQREKESAHDYRYFPEPDIPPIVDLDLESLKMPELTENILQAIIDQGVPEQAAKVLVANKKLLKDFNLAVSGNHAKTVANLYVNRLRDMSIAPEKVGQLAALIDEGKISPSSIPEIINDIKKGKSIAEIVNSVSSDGQELESMVREAIANNPSVVASYNKGVLQAVGVIVGDVMRASGGKTDAKKVRELIINELSGPNN